MEKRKVYGTIIGVTFFVLLIIGAAYAYFYWSSSEAERTNVNLTIKKGLENSIVYKQGTSILETDDEKLEASESYTGGISATIEFWKKPTATQTIYGQISLEILKMLSITNTTDANIGKTNTIKWAITTYTVDDATEVLLNEGTFNGTRQGNKFPLSEDFELNTIQTFYKVYIWLDSSAIDGTLSVIGELLSTEISASASDIQSHYGAPPLQVLTSLGLADDLKEGTPNFNVISPVVTAYSQNISSGQTVNLDSTITGNKTLGTGVSFDTETGEYTLTGASTYQSYNNNAVGKYTCNGAASTCTTVYKITAVNVNSATTNYSETDWASYGTALTSSSDKTIGTSYTFDGTYYQLAGTISSSVSYGTDYVSTSEVSYYTCNNNTGTDCNVLYRIESVSGTSATVVRKQRTQNLNYATQADIYTNKVSSYNEADIGIFASEDDFGTSYYFRGNVENNYVKFAKNADGQDMYWRIIRINGDGTIRMIYDGISAHENGEKSSDRTLGNVLYKSGNVDDNTYAGYMYGTADASAYEETHSNSYNSTIKDYLENTWYKNNILDTGYSNYVSDAIYCNDRTVNNSSELAGIGKNETNYVESRLSSAPTLKCAQINDQFTVSGDLGNGKNLYPIGLITVDEVNFAGGKAYNANYNYYLYTGINSGFWTMSPRAFNVSANVVSIWYVGKDGGYRSIAPSGAIDAKPVISLKSNVIKSGTGTMTDPFKVE